MVVFACILAFTSVWGVVYIILSRMTQEFAQHRKQGGEVTDCQPIERFIALSDLLQLRITSGLLGSIFLESMLIYAGVSKIWVHFLVAGLMFVLFFQLPFYWYHWKVKRRRAEFSTKLLDFTMGIRAGLRAGVALPDALRIVGKDIGGVFQEEMNIVLSEKEANVPLDEALWHLNKRMPDENLTLLVTAIDLSQKSGGSLVEILDSIIETIRNRNVFYDKIDANTAQGKIDAMIMGLAPFGVFVLLLWKDPALMLPMVTTYMGWLALTIALVLDIAGCLIIKRMMTLNY